MVMAKMLIESPQLRGLLRSVEPRGRAALGGQWDMSKDARADED